MADTCDRMDDRCKLELTVTLMALMADWLHHHGTKLYEQKGNDVIREILTEMLQTLPTVEQMQEAKKIFDLANGQNLGEA